MTEEHDQPADEAGQAAPVPATAAVTSGATEAARELAAANMVDLEEIRGTGAAGKITRADVEEHIAARATPLAPIPAPAQAEAEAATEAAADDVPAYEPPPGGHAPKVWTGPRR